MIRIKQLIAILTTLIALVAACLIVNFVTGIGKDVVTVMVAPKDTKLTIEGKAIGNNKVKLKTGTYTIKASRDGFTDQTKEYTTVNSRHNELWFIMLPSSDTGTEYQKNHQKEFQRAYDFANSFASEAVQSKVLSYPLLKKMPVNVYPLFTINEGQSKKHPNDDTKRAIYINSGSPESKNSALSYIYSLGFDPSDYEIIFGQINGTSGNGPGSGDRYEGTL
jgi:hypothetical protein